MNHIDLVTHLRRTVVITKSYCWNVISSDYEMWFDKFVWLGFPFWFDISTLVM